MVPARGSRPAVWPALVSHTNEPFPLLCGWLEEIVFIIFSRASLSEPNGDGETALGGTLVPARRSTPTRWLARRGPCRIVENKWRFKPQYIKDKKKNFNSMLGFRISLFGWGAGLTYLLKKLLQLYATSIFVVYKDIMLPSEASSPCSPCLPCLTFIYI